MFELSSIIILKYGIAAPPNRNRTRSNINPNNTKANAAGRSVRARVMRKSKL
jgi:hypothetical protein